MLLLVCILCSGILLCAKSSDMVFAFQLIMMVGLQPRTNHLPVWYVPCDNKSWFLLINLLHIVDKQAVKSYFDATKKQCGVLHAWTHTKQVALLRNDRW